MDLDPSDAIRIIVLLVLLLFSAFFSSAETAFTTVNRIRIRTLAEDNNARALLVQEILERYSKMLTSILVGNNIVNLSASALTTSLVLRHFQGGVLGGYAVGVSTFILTSFVLVFGEIVPTRLAAAHAESYALSYAPFIRAFIRLLTPVVFVVGKVSDAFMRFLRQESKDPFFAMTEEELKTYVDVGHEDGVIESDEKKLIYNVFDFSDAVAKDVMIPRIDMVTAPLSATYAEVFAIFRENMYTRIPVYEDDPDRIVGLVNIKDFLLVENTDALRLKDILRSAYYTYEFKKIDDLLTEMRGRAMNVAFVLNEYGATVGMITMEDLLEELVGEIRDEYDHDEDELITQIYDRQYLVASGMKLDDINDALGTSFDSENYDSLGGIIIEALDRMPQDKDTVTLSDGTTLKVCGVKDNRIEKVLLTLPSEASKEAP